MKNIIELLNKCLFYRINKLSFSNIIVCLLIMLTILPMSYSTDNSIYTTLSNQIALNDELSITANNMSNANTSGFKRDIQIMSSYTSKDKIDNLKMPDDIASIPDFTAGSLKQTNNPFNIAINGDGFFMIETQNGISYSRNGNFLINNEGILIDQQGNYVLSDGGDQIVIPLQNSNVFINKNGNIYSSNELIGVIGIYKLL
ncbi:flagellar hook-basal body complex protein [Candidatus Aquarickettsia rohweri]|uniref:Flagellar hook-basal body complex protein n=1 Tax=Candidatus Aquarickettsia rohweri TaxID=2602574 RepID=A0A3R9ZRT8_9RICK|nr:flagellar hook-basal body complex protein [Candidatus Aquarickettsia rohweri]RST71567.1 flagellar hook-basal body complex protein [Candidatus Aquarickettsia rohweri]